MTVKIGGVFAPLCLVLATVLFISRMDAQPPGTTSAVSGRQALVVINSRYSTLPVLPFAEGDGSAVADALRLDGFDVESRINLGVVDWRYVEDAFTAKLHRGDVAVVYFIGYGIQNGGDNWLLGWDYDPNARRPLSSMAYSVLRLRQVLEEKHLKLAIIVLDAARRGPSSLAPMEGDAHTVFVYSLPPGRTESASETSPFTQALVKVLHNSGVNIQRSLTVDLPAAVHDLAPGRAAPFVSFRTREEFEFSAEPRPGQVKVNPKDLLTYVWIPPGTFQMGCSPGDQECLDDEKPAHTVTISKGFWIGRTEVTQEAYERVMGSNPSHFRGPKLPVEGISLDQARTYCSAAGVRLPTEAEWEYAARAGSSKDRYGDLDAIAWYAENSGGKTHEVGQKAANAWGLYDMLGNVWEWVADFYGEYQAGSSTDPEGSPSGPFLHRGGTWFHHERGPRASFRDRIVPAGSPHQGVGVRCAGNSVSALPTHPAKEQPTDAGHWITAFDGKSLAGWSAIENPQSWSVQNGVLIGQGAHSHLFYTAARLADFEFSAEVRINAGGNSGMLFRAPLEGGLPRGYEAQVSNTGDPQLTGSLYGFAPIREQLVQDGTWFTQQILARGNHIVILVNGRRTVDFIDDKNTYGSGYLALQVWGMNTRVEYRNIRVRVLDLPNKLP